MPGKSGDLRGAALELISCDVVGWTLSPLLGFWKPKFRLSMAAEPGGCLWLLVWFLEGKADKRWSCDRVQSEPHSNVYEFRSRIGVIRLWYHSRGTGSSLAVQNFTLQWTQAKGPNMDWVQIIASDEESTARIVVKIAQLPCFTNRLAAQLSYAGLNSRNPYPI